METYKCLNPNCGQVWQSNEEPFECPSCHETNFINVKNPDPGFFKKNWWVILVAVVVVAFVVFLFLRNSGGDTQVNAVQDTKAGTITVTIKGNHENDYRIQLLKGGAEFQKVENVNETVFNIIDDGTYTLNIQYIGGGKAPEINQYQNVFIFEEVVSELDVDDVTELDKDQVTPQIVQIDYSPTTPSSKYTVTLKIDLKGDYAKNVEYAIDDGRWQNKSEFKNVKPGRHTFRARNKKNHAKENVKGLTLMRPYEESGETEISEIKGSKISVGDKPKMDGEPTNVKKTTIDGGSTSSKSNLKSNKNKNERTVPESKTSNKKTMSASEINQLLDKVANGDEKASDKLALTLGNNTPVSGVKLINNVQDLLLDAFLGHKYRVTQVKKDSKGNIVALTIEAK